MSGLNPLGVGLVAMLLLWSGMCALAVKAGAMWEAAGYGFLAIAVIGLIVLLAKEGRS